uniref:Serine/threonine-protein phosphatase n=1 Tax=Pseudonaja textilis TaxID=8673 RepID=A0A670YHQ8_PSETE
MSAGKVPTPFSYRSIILYLGLQDTVSSSVLSERERERLLASCKESSRSTIKAAILIQRWYRSYMARLEMRRRYSLTIFQSIEYADEQAQISHFFSSSSDYAISIPDHAMKEYERIIEVPASYRGPHLCFPLTVTDTEVLLQAFKDQQQLHARYVLQLFHETRKVLQQMPNITHLSTSYAKEVTICGDLHGKLDDLLLIFYKNGLPSEENPYVFNGDFVDRGKNSMEILIILFAFLLVYPNHLHLNRGNHEDHLMNLRYGFTKEIMKKYKTYGKPILHLLEDVYSWLPLATIIDNQVLILHGGISDTTDLNFLNSFHRNKVGIIHIKVLCYFIGCRSSLVMDILWSDPKHQNGCSPNKIRGGGCYFGPDITARLLQRYNLKLLIRSHQCKQEGYEISHNGKVITIFSASNYYEEGSNRGAYIKLNPDVIPHFVQYQVSKSTRKQTLHQRVTAIELSALKGLREKLYTHKSDLIAAFTQYDPLGTGRISLGQWASAMESVLHLDIPWRTLRSRLVCLAPDGSVEYLSCFDNLEIILPIKEVQPYLVETLYRYKADLEIIFNMIDQDHSGLISADEFRQTWKLFNAHVKNDVSDESIDSLARTMDFNKDGSIDFNEFLEAFRIVHKFSYNDQPS